MSTSHTIWAHAQEVWEKSDKDYWGCQSGWKVITHNSKSDLPLVPCNGYRCYAGHYIPQLEGYNTTEPKGCSQVVIQCMTTMKPIHVDG